MPDALKEQLELEEIMSSRGRERYLRMVEDDRAKGFGFTEGLCNSYIRLHSCPTDLARTKYGFKGDVTLTDAIKETLETPRPGRNAKGWDLLRDTGLPPQDVAFIILPLIMNGAGEGRTRGSVVGRMSSALEDEVNQREIRRQSVNEYNNLQRMTQARIMNASDRRFASKLLAKQNAYTWDGWDREKAYNIGVALYAIVLHICNDAIEEIREVTFTSSGKKCYNKILGFTGAFAENEQACLEEIAMSRSLLGPLLVPPKDWDDPFTGGYHGVLAGVCTGVHSSLPNYKKGSARQWNPESLHIKALNKQQKVAYSINKQVWEVAKEISSWANAEEFSLHSGELHERPRQPKFDDWVSDEVYWKAWRDYRKEAKDYVQELRKANSRKISHRRLLSIIEDYVPKGRFYYVHFLDWRGRLYVADNCGMSYQGSPLIKGLIQFASGSPVGERGVYWVKVHTANCYGEDKVSFDARVQWTDDRMKDILAVAENPLDVTWWRDADSPWEFLACCFELASIKTHGADHVSHLIVGQDGTCNGSQHMSAMVRCEHTASKVNLVPTDAPNDLYAEVARATHPLITRDAEELGDHQHLVEEIKKLDNILANKSVKDPKKLDALREKRIKTVKALAPAILEPYKEEYVDRKLLKTNVMTSTYNVSPYGMRQQLREVMFDRVNDGKCDYIRKLDVFGIAQYLHEGITEALGTTLVATVDVMGYLKELVRVLAQEDIALTWWTPTGYWVNHSYPEYDSHQITYRYKGKHIKIRMNKNTVRQSESRAVNGISANYTHSLDASHLAMTVMGCPFELCTVHDSFGCHPSNVDDMRVTLRSTFRDLYSQDLLTKLREDTVRQVRLQVPQDRVDEVLSKLPQVPTRGGLRDEDILEATYMFA